MPFHYKDKGIMAMIGRNAAVAEVGKHRHQVEGPMAFAAWLGVHAMLLSGVHSKTDAFLTGRGTTSTGTTPPPSRCPQPRPGWPGQTTARTSRTSCWTDRHHGNHPHSHPLRSQ